MTAVSLSLGSLFVSLDKGSPGRHSDAEGVEESRRDGRSEHGIGSPIDADRETFAGPRGEPLHGGDVRGQMSVLRVARERTEPCVRRADLADTEQAVGLNASRWRCQQTAHGRIHGGVAADHERDKKRSRRSVPGHARESGLRLAGRATPEETSQPGRLDSPGNGNVPPCSSRSNSAQRPRDTECSYDDSDLERGVDPPAVQGRTNSGDDDSDRDTDVADRAVDAHPGMVASVLLSGADRPARPQPREHVANSGQVQAEQHHGDSRRRWSLERCVREGCETRTCRLRVKLHRAVVAEARAPDDARDGPSLLGDRP